MNLINKHMIKRFKNNFKHVAKNDHNNTVDFKSSKDENKNEYISFYMLLKTMLTKKLIAANNDYFDDNT